MGTSVRENHEGQVQLHNGERWADFCQTNELMIGGTLFPHKDCHKRTWISPDGSTLNQLDHVAFSKRWKSLLRDVCIMRGADIGSDHHLLIAKVRIKIAKVKKGRICRVHFEVTKLSDLETRDVFKLGLHNRFECLQQLEEEE